MKKKSVLSNKLSSLSYQLICALFALIVIGVIFAFVPRYYSHPSGLLLPTQHTRPAASSNQIILYNTIPVSAEVIGQINIQQQYTADQQLAERQMVTYAEILAARKGANGMVIKAIDFTPPGSVPSNQMKYQLTATAIYVRGNND